MMTHDDRRHWIFCIAGLAIWLAVGWPVLDRLFAGAVLRGAPVSQAWLIPFAVFGAAAFAAMALRLPAWARWALLGVQVVAVAAMTVIVPWAQMTYFLIVPAWQVALATRPATALAVIVGQTLVVIGALAQALNPDLCWVIGNAFALQLLMMFTAQALRNEAAAARALAAANDELRAAQALIASTVRDAERLRISRELHDAWGHELTALGLQLEIASHVAEPGRATEHVAQAKGLARALLTKVRDVVATLRDERQGDLRATLEALANSVPRPAIHVAIAPDVSVDPDQAHALIRCAQEAVTNAVRHAEAANLWFQVTRDGDGVRLIARDDGTARPAAAPGSGLVGMRERVETLGGRLAVRSGAGFTVDAWLPLRVPRPA